MATMALFLDAMYSVVAPMGVELSFLLFFGLGFLFLRIDKLSKGSPKNKKKSLDFDESLVKPFDEKLKKTIEAEAAASHPEEVITAWQAGQAQTATPPELLKIVVSAFVQARPESMVQELLQHTQEHAAALANARTAFLMLDIVARAGQVNRMMELFEGFKQLRVTPTSQIYEVLLGGFASTGDHQKVDALMEDLRAADIKLTARGYSLTIKGFLKNGMVDKVLEQILEMCKHNFQVPPFAVTQFFRIACEAGRAADTLEVLRPKVQLSPEAVALLLEHCAKRQDLDFAKHVESISRQSNVPFLCSAFDSLLKLNTMAGDVHALELFSEMQGSGIRISEGLCVGLLARCAEAKFLRFAEEIVRFVRGRAGMSIAMYSALMKVYAYCGMYDKACDLYDLIRQDGLEPDNMMYGCLMKFAVECGRTELSRELSEKAPSLDIQNYMSLIRAAGRDRNVSRAFEVLDRLKKSGTTLDIAAYNCVLDVCVLAGDMIRARQLLDEMKDMTSSLDVITYNTLLKGYCSSGDLKGAKALLLEMKAAGHPPNDVSYNCLINAAVSRYGGSFNEAWSTVEMMESDGVAVDHYTISIMMKALKKMKNPKDVGRTLALLDRSNIDVCSDEILFNTVLETCIRHREYRRLESILAAYSSSSLRPSVHTYGSLIKACSTLKRLDDCRKYWQEMEELRGIEPNDIVLGCMLDALVCNGQIDEAVDLLEKWKARVPPNTVIYSTIIKGFANSRQSERAMATWQSMRNEGVKMNTVVYNALVDAQARVGEMDNVSKLVEGMAPDGCTPDSITYSTIVKGYCVKGDLDKAFEVFRNMQNNKMAADSIIYNTVLDGCTRHGRMDLADKLLEDMETFEIVPSNFTLGILVKMWGRRKQLDKALEVVETLPRRHGFAANAQVYTCLMCACLNNNALDRALEVFEKMRASPDGADAKAYGALIGGLVRQSQLEKAVQLVEEAYGFKTGGNADRKRWNQAAPIEGDCLEQLLRAIGQRGLADRLGAPLLEKLRAAKAPITGRLYNAMMSSPDAADRGHPWARRGAPGGRR